MAIGRMKPYEKRLAIGPVGFPWHFTAPGDWSKTPKPKTAGWFWWRRPVTIFCSPHLCWLTLLVEHPLLMLKRHNWFYWLSTKSISSAFGRHFLFFVGLITYFLVNPINPHLFLVTVVTPKRWTCHFPMTTLLTFSNWSASRIVSPSQKLPISLYQNCIPSGKQT